LFYQQRTINFNGHQWLLVFDHTSTSAGISYVDAWATLIGGLALSGFLFWLLISMRASAIRDIAAHELAARRQVEASRMQLAAIVESSNDAIIGKTTDGIITSWNKSAENIYGYSADEIIGRHVTVIAPPSRHTEIYELLEKVSKGGTVVNHESERIRKDGSLFNVALTLSPIKDASGKITGISTIARDITEKKRLEEELRQLNTELEQRVQNRTRELSASEERMRLFFERQLVGMAITSPEKGWVKVNDKICEMMGYSPEELARLSWAEMTYPEDLAPDEAQFKRLLNGEIDSYTLEKRFVRKDGSIVFTNLSVGCVRRADQSVDYVLALLEDITEQKSAEESIKKLNDELQLRAKALEGANQELESFSYSVSHDLRTPLRAIDGFSHILLEDYADKLDDEGKRLLNIVRDNTSRMGQLIDDILKFSRTGRLELSFTEINMEKLAHEVFEELQPSDTDSKLQLEVEPIPPVTGDSAMMRQVFVNLLSNAIKFSRPRETARIKVGGSIEGNEAIYYVKDNGVGFDMQYVDKLFGVFQRLHGVTEFEGTGIGLAIVKRIITRHGGRVWAEGKVNEDATIYFALPTKEKNHG
jgi:PAS domain S-box-containing protein